MYIYYSIALLFYFVALTDCCSTTYSGKLLSKYSVFLLILSCLCLGSLRWECGTDWEPYYRFFMSSAKLSELRAWKFDYAYTLLVWLVRQITDNYTFFLVVLSIACIIPKVNAITNLSLLPGVSLFLYFCFNFFDIFAVRQTLSITCIVFALKFLVENKKVHYYLLVILAILFHKSALLFLFVYPIYKHTFSKRQLILLLLISLIIGLFGHHFFSALITICNKLGSLFPYLSVLERVNGYFLIDEEVSVRAIILGIVKRCVILPLFLFCCNSYEKDKKFLGFRNLYIVGCLIYLIFIRYFRVFQRLSTPFSFFEIFLIPYSIKNNMNKKNYIFVLLFLCLYGGSKLWYGISIYYDLYCPYKWVF